MANDLLRELAVKVVERGVSWNALGKECGLGGANPGTQLRRILGITPSYTTKNNVPYGPYFQSTITEELAERLTRAIGADPIDVGL